MAMRVQVNSLVMPGMYTTSGKPKIAQSRTSCHMLSHAVTPTHVVNMPPYAVTHCDTLLHAVAHALTGCRLLLHAVKCCYVLPTGGS